MLVDLARSAHSVVVLGLALGDVKIAAWDDNVGGVCRACPFLTVGTVAVEAQVY